MLAKASPSTNYRVDLPLFEGPLDLLLSLVDKEKLDITEISLAHVARQYQAYLESLERLNLELESSYVVVFAQLLEIKSRVLLPPEPEEFDSEFYPSEIIQDEEESENDLVEQLKAYKLLKEAADWLGDREVFSRAQYAHPCQLAEPDQPELDVSLAALAAAWVRLDTSVRSQRQAVELKRVEISVPERVKQIFDWMKGRTRGWFSQLLEKNESRSYLVVTFLAVLELVRRNRIHATQTNIEADIEITNRTEDMPHD